MDGSALVVTDDRNAKDPEWLVEMAQHVERQFLQLEAEGSELVMEFRAEKIELIARLNEQLAAETAISKRRRRAYLPLNLFARLHRGHMEVYWQEVHQNPRTKTAAYTYIRKSTKEGGYTTRHLKTFIHGGEEEVDLVLRTEAKAHSIRSRWKSLIKIQASLRAYSRNAGKLRQGGGSEKSD